MQPTYHKCPYKIKARAENAAVYRRMSGSDCLPIDRQYWTLCNSQPNESGSEIVQMEDIGLFQRNQFVGVDRDAEIIQQNREWHPQATWHCGEWLKIIQDSDDFNPSLIHLDLTGFADGRIVTENLANTMLLCPSQTVLLANFMLNDPRSSRQFDPNTILRNIERQVPASELSMWKSKVENFVYSSTGRTFLITYIFAKQ